MILRYFLFAILSLTFFFPSVSFASDVLQNLKRSGETSGNVAYDFPIYGVGQTFTATSTFSFQSVDFYLKSTGVAGYGCARGYLIKVESGLYNNVIATSTECVYAENLTSSFATTTFSFVPVVVQSGSTYVVALSVVSSLAPSADAIKISLMNISPLGSTRCGLTGLPDTWSCSSANNVNFVIRNTGGATGFYTTTQIVDFEPANGTTTPNPVDFSLTVYVADADVDSPYYMNAILYNIDQNVLGVFSFFSPDDFTVFNEDITTVGLHYFSTSTTLSEGNYRVEACISKLAYNLHIPWSTVDDCQSHQFVVGTPTFIGNISQNSWSAMNEYYASSSATSTASLAGTCVPYIGFDVRDCLAFLFVPDSYLLQTTFANFRLNVFTHFPVGYVTDFLSIISSSTPASLILLDVTLPAGMIGAGSRLTLDATNVFDFVLNATTSQFAGVSASDDRTFFEITNQYWSYLVFLGALFYILRRIMGSGVIPHMSQHDN